MGFSYNSVDQLLAIGSVSGLPPSNFVPQALRAQCATVAQRNVPPGAPASFVMTCTASLIGRGIFYWKQNPGDCGANYPLDLTNASLTGSAGSIAASIAGSFGASIPGLGAAVQAIESIFAHHAQAVQTEQTTICQVASVINKVLAYYDDIVRRGLISPSTAYTAMQQYLAQVNAKLQTIYKSCNASCVYIGILAAHADFVKTYYPAIAPVQVAAHAPGAPPAVNGTRPGGVIQVGGALPSIWTPAPPTPAPPFFTPTFHPPTVVNGVLVPPVVTVSASAKFSNSFLLIVAVIAGVLAYKYL